MSRSPSFIAKYILANLLLCAAFPCLSQRVDSSTIQGKVLVGYQGWFRCEGDRGPRDVWSAWFIDDLRSARLQSSVGRTWGIDLFPDVSEMNPSSLCPIPGVQVNGKQAYLFSSFPKATEDTHFRWMRQYGIDGALIQRFATGIPHYQKEHDTVLRNALASAEQNGRVIAVEYDISGGNPDMLLDQLKQDWLYLTNDLKIVNSPAYLYERKKPVVSLWGIGLKSSKFSDPVVAKKIVDWFKSEGHATVIGGVPGGWATLSGDAANDPAWSEVYKDLDIVQPWTVGRYKDTQSAAAWTATHVAADLAITRRNHQEYMPVVFPGFSWHNKRPNSPLNEIPRQGGTFLWQQAMGDKSAGSTMLKIAMFDEVNEGTAIFKVAARKSDTPAEVPFVTLDMDGVALPNDWYLRLAGDITRVYHGEEPASMTMPSQPLKPSSR